MWSQILYGLIHQRYITAPEGLERMRQKYERGDFGYCPRVLCQGTKLLPCGVTDELRARPVKTFCSMCRNLYHVRLKHAQQLDGAYFGQSFPHVFLLKFPKYQAPCQPIEYKPKIFGFDMMYPDNLPTAEEYARQLEAIEKEKKEAEEKKAKAEAEKKGEDKEGEKKEEKEVEPKAAATA
mmetsp:Transcript_14289/g.25715  ORF Transcript_14289/g.25715 Transcript_14289/m.25715 type:complete len:180 (+) Transcript_14289:224-763(+)